jgi:DNA-binding CsgD family transcriptional regulator
MKYAFLLTVALVIIGLGADLIVYYSTGKMPLVVLNGVSMLIYGALLALYRLKKIYADNALLYCCQCLAINIGMSILYEASLNTVDSPTIILTDVGIGMLPTILSGVAQARRMPMFISIFICGCYVAAAVWMQNSPMLWRSPVLLLLLIGLAYGYSYMLSIGLKTEMENAKAQEENIRVREEQEKIFRMLNLTPLQQKMLKDGRLDSGYMENILEKMEKTTRERLMFEMRKRVHSDEEVKARIREKHPSLSKGDLEMCCMIVKGMTASEISRVSNVRPQSVTSRRSRMRTKLELSPEQNLNDYLTSLINS